MPTEDVLVDLTTPAGDFTPAVESSLIIDRSHELMDQNVNVDGEKDKHPQSTPLQSGQADAAGQLNRLELELAQDRLEQDDRFERLENRMTNLEIQINGLVQGVTSKVKGLLLRSC